MSNLGQRLITAALLIAAFLAALLLAPAWMWMAFVALFVSGGAWEWAGLAKFKSLPRILYCATTLLLALAAWRLELADQGWIYLPALLFWTLAVPLWLRRRWPLPPPLASALLGWLLLLPAFLALLLLREVGPLALLAVVGVAIVADSAAYFVGRAYGKTKLAPAISPGKTWEGALGGAAAIALYAMGIAYLTHPVLSLGLLVTFLLLFVMSVLGDLFESLIKRQAGVKDSGNLLPGHGGLLDRIDSQLAVLPVAALFWIALGAH